MMPKSPLTLVASLPRRREHCLGPSAKCEEGSKHYFAFKNNRIVFESKNLTIESNIAFVLAAHAAPQTMFGEQ